MRIQNLEKLKLPSEMKIRVLNEYPYVVKINNLLTEGEIEEILQLAKGKFEKSNIVVNGELVYNTRQRNSSTAYLFKDGMPDKYSKRIERIIKKICYLTSCERSQLEIMCVRYRQGEYFGKHVDYFDEHEVDKLDSGGNRLCTFFVYLNTLQKEDGGETEFTKLGIKSRPKKGDAIFFINQNLETGEMIPETEHQGNPVLTEKVKYGINIWTRTKPFY
jgi:prolyl 4-hydroxylase